MLKTYQALYDHGQVKWLSQPPAEDHFKMLVVVEQHEQSVIPKTLPEEGYGLLHCQQPGLRHLLGFDVAEAMRRIND